MSLDALRALIPAYAKDISLNLSSLANEPALNDQQKWGAFLAAACAVGQPELVEMIESQARSAGLTDAALNAARGAAAIMAMNNVYYRALHLMANADYKPLPARLRMNVIANPGVDKADFELWCMAVSAINGCGMCLDAHEAELRQGGMPIAAIQSALRIAAVVNAAGRVVAAERAAS